MSVAAAFLLSWFLVGAWAKAMRSLGLGKAIREDGPKSHHKKAGTPSMGGVPMAVAAGLVAFFLGGLEPAPALLALGFLLIGLLDDLGPPLFGRPLRAREKLPLQFLAAAAFAAYAPLPDYLGHSALNFLFVLLVVVGAANAMNFTDGVDGLAASVGAILLLPFLASPLAGAAVGALLGFLWHNAPPARIFMGDSGSEALGVLIAAYWLLSGGGWFLAVAALVPLAELLSVVVQVLYFRATGGRRILRMAPLHHHFELSGWSEGRVVLRFAAVTAAAVALAVGLWRGL